MYSLNDIRYLFKKKKSNGRTNGRTHEWTEDGPILLCPKKSIFLRLSVGWWHWRASHNYFLRTGVRTLDLWFSSPMWYHWATKPPLDTYFDTSRKYDQLTLEPPSKTILPYANSLDLDETPSNSASHPDPSCLTLWQQFQIFERHWSILKIETDKKFNRRQFIRWAKG